MTLDADLLKTLEEALAADPSKLGVRRHLAELLLADGRPEEALRHAQRVLSEQPADLKALGVAAEAARQTGETRVAEGYEQLLGALAEGTTRKPGEISREAAEDSATEPGPEPGEEPDDDLAPVVPLRLVQGDDEEIDPQLVDLERPTVTLEDVGGLESVKRRLELSFLAPLRNPELRRAYRKSLRGGLLLYGPPGCGKTFVARALAGELSARFLSVGLADVLDMWLGQSERNLHELFELARRSSPCVLFVDEIDALGRSRSLMRHSAAGGVVQQFLSELDGVAHDNEGVFVLAATNQPWDVDPAMRRPGRLDRTLLVTPPDLPARLKILEVHLRDRPTEDLSLDHIAKATEEYSGADLAHLCEVATELAMEASAATGEVRPITQKDLKKAMKEVRPSIRPWLETARNYALFANEGGAYDDLVEYLRRRKMA